jgi:acyl dehydratase
MSIEAAKAIGLDLSDLERRAGQWIGGGDLWEPASALDIRRWVQAMDYPNPIHWDEEFARASQFGGIVAPQSFVQATDYGHSGITAAIVGHIPNAHMMIAGEEWWYSTYRIRPGDKITQRRRFDGFTVKETAFAGPTAFTRGDTFHTSAAGAPVAHSRTTALRYSAAEADRRQAKQGATGEAKQWTEAELAEVAAIRHDWILSNREGHSPRIGAVKPGDRLPTRAVGPLSIASLVSEWRAWAFQTWGASRWVRPDGVDDPWVNNDPGTLKGNEIDHEGGRIDPALLDGLYRGPAAAHVDGRKARAIGMPRPFGYGGSMGAWFADYVAYWAGNNGRLRHSKLALRGPVLEGDVTYLNGEVVGVEALSPLLGVPLVAIKVQITNQDGALLVDGVADVEVQF